MQQLEDVEIERLKSRLIERLEKQGYEVKRDDSNACKSGKSGAEHSFLLLAHRDDRFIAYTIAIDIAQSDDDQQIGLGDIFAFDDKCYDCGIKDKAFIAIPGLDPVATRFAQNQRIRVFHKETLEAFLDSPLPTPAAEKESLDWENSSQIMGSLARLGYKIEKNARLKGRSGAEYTFDTLAFWNDGFISRRLGIDELTGGEIGLSQISLFDVKAYDTSIQEKILLVSGSLSTEAIQFAQHQGIRIIQFDGQTQKPAPIEESTMPDLQSAVEELLTAESTAAPQRRTRHRPDPKVLELIPETMARRFNTMPIAIVGNALQVMMANPSDIFALEALALQSQMRIEPMAGSEREIREAIDFNYKGGLGQIEEQVSRISSVGEVSDEQALIEAADDTPVASALRIVIDEAAKARASDIHIEPEEDILRIRYRVDGALQEVMSLPLRIHLPLTSRIKIMADMNIADHLRPQDGQFSVESKGRSIDIRVATSPTVHGETTVMRLLDKSLGVMDLPQLGFSADSLARYENMLKVAFGMILISGPTGSGTTTPLYASVNKLDKVSSNIIKI